MCAYHITIFIPSGNRCFWNPHTLSKTCNAHTVSQKWYSFIIFDTASLFLIQLHYLVFLRYDQSKHFPSSLLLPVVCLETTKQLNNTNNHTENSDTENSDTKKCPSIRIYKNTNYAVVRGCHNLNLSAVYLWHLFNLGKSVLNCPLRIIFHKCHQNHRLFPDYHQCQVQWGIWRPGQTRESYADARETSTTSC